MLLKLILILYKQGRELNIQAVQNTLWKTREGFNFFKKGPPLRPSQKLLGVHTFASITNKRKIIIETQPKPVEILKKH